MVEHTKNATTYLYHYTSAKTALDHILKTKLLRLGPYTKTNDPKETKSWQFDLGTNEDRDLGKYKQDQQSRLRSSEHAVS